MNPHKSYHSEPPLDVVFLTPMRANKDDVWASAIHPCQKLFIILMTIWVNSSSGMLKLCTSCHFLSISCGHWSSFLLGKSIQAELLGHVFILLKSDNQLWLVWLIWSVVGNWEVVGLIPSLGKCLPGQAPMGGNQWRLLSRTEASLSLFLLLSKNQWKKCPRLRILKTGQPKYMCFTWSLLQQNGLCLWFFPDLYLWFSESNFMSESQFTQINPLWHCAFLLTANKHIYFPEIYNERIKCLWWLWFSGIEKIFLSYFFWSENFNPWIKADSDMDGTW